MFPQAQVSTSLLSVSQMAVAGCACGPSPLQTGSLTNPHGSLLINPVYFMVATGQEHAWSSQSLPDH